MDNDNRKNNEKHISRRKFIANSSYLVGGIIGGGILGGFIFNQQESSTVSNNVIESSNRQEALMYFTSQEDFDIIKAATERILPKDENGPGAIDLHVPIYIDQQLAGAWGQNVRDYMNGPHYDILSTDYQTRLKRSQIFDLGINAIKKYCDKNYEEKFPELDEKEQDEVLKKFEANEIEIPGVSSGLFFELLRSATIEGVYCDPLYGGNYNMNGWKMKKFPGSQMSYLNDIESDEFQEIEPKSLSNLINLN